MANTKYTAIHELPYTDDLVGRTAIKPGQEIPTGIFKEADLERLAEKKAIKLTKEVKAEEKAADQGGLVGTNAGKASK